MVKIKSRVYNQDLIIFGEKISFKNGVAEISEELWQQIVDSKFPNIYKEGEEPEYRTKLEETLRKEVKEGNEEFVQEINRLKGIIKELKKTISQRDEEISSWKKCVEDLKNNKETVIPEKNEKKEDDGDSNDLVLEDDALKNDLIGMKKDELIELAKSEDGGNFTDEDLKGKKKEEIVSMIIEKVK